ncbi:MAG: ATP-binding protein, partial [Desulfuromonadales bacterium]|nr:ATP-binding protein [Pseudomonadales bacterium]NIQ93019.1 ATP-binding protein [Desulfuromonadales bacterium]NIS39391.1 ATP-binding protein [Desulfuromonadales bacterium]NIX06980.1 ATP-binding protein [Pseudomonadales bacterium]
MLSLPPHGETSAKIAGRVAEARAVQAERMNGTRLTNGELEGEILDKVATPDQPGQEVLRAA